MPFVTFAERYGMEKGEIKGLLRAVELGLELKFGAEGLTLMPQVRQIDDAARLGALIDKLKAAANLDEIRQALA